MILLKEGFWNGYSFDATSNRTSDFAKAINGRKAEMLIVGGVNRSYMANPKMSLKQDEIVFTGEVTGDPQRNFQGDSFVALSVCDFKVDPQEKKIVGLIQSSDGSKTGFVLYLS